MAIVQTVSLFKTTRNRFSLPLLFTWGPLGNYRKEADDAVSGLGSLHVFPKIPE
jgi:hypothetical protein